MTKLTGLCTNAFVTYCLYHLKTKNQLTLQFTKKTDRKRGEKETGGRRKSRGFFFFLSSLLVVAVVVFVLFFVVVVVFFPPQEDSPDVILCG